jgi:hypothetical protein
MRKLYTLFLAVTGSILSVSCSQAWGDNDLGDNLSLLEGDRREDRVVVYCTGRSGSTCTSGMRIVPSNSRYMNSEGRYAEYADSAVADKKWVIVKTLVVGGTESNYWIIEKGFTLEGLNCDVIKCDSILQCRVRGPFSQDEFEKQKNVLRVDLNFNGK